ncbi:MAG: hypothetical protein H6760_02190 [Candidatus Nomurabacteria bacterium]|nr:MAG: hypothetical protein H6760_02190 [Candidatus Nomurabacteria bacterium]
MNSPLQHESLLEKVGLIALALFFSACTLLIVLRAPYQAGGDLFFHTWFTQQIIDSGQIPQSAPTYAAATHYSLAPLFHFIIASIQSVVHIPLTTLLPLLNIGAAALWISLLFLVIKQSTRRVDAALFGALLSIFFTEDSSFFYLLPRTVSMCVVLAAMYVLNSTLTRFPRLIMLSLFSLSILLLHLPSAPFWLSILATLSIVRAWRDYRKILHDIFAFGLGAALFIILLLPEILKNGIPINPSDSSFQSQSDAPLAIAQLLHVVQNPFVAISIILGLAGLLTYTYRSKNKTSLWMLWAFLIASTLVAMQEFGQYAFLPERAISYLFIPFSLLAGYAYLAINSIIPNSYRVIIFTLLLLTIIPLGALQLLNSNEAPLKDAVSHDELQGLNDLREALPEGAFASDPLTMVKIASITNLQPAISFEATNLRAASVRNWPIVIGLFGPEENLIPYLTQNNIKYIILSTDTYQRFLHLDERFASQAVFENIFTSKQTITLEGFSDPIPYYAVYRYLGANEE